MSAAVIVFDRADDSMSGAQTTGYVLNEGRRRAASVRVVITCTGGGMSGTSPLRNFKAATGNQQGLLLC
jgi:uncharacterized protein (DUF39 family)